MGQHQAGFGPILQQGSWLSEHLQNPFQQQYVPSLEVAQGIPCWVLCSEHGIALSPMDIPS